MTRCPTCHGSILTDWGGEPSCLACGREPGAVPTLATAATRRPMLGRINISPRRVRGGIRGDG